jgi:hypothetical protein
MCRPAEVTFKWLLHKYIAKTSIRKIGVLKRFSVAVIITSATSALILAAMSTITLHANGEFGSKASTDVILNHFGSVWLLGSCAAACWAVLLAFIVELPKLKLSRLGFMNGMWPGVFLSILGIEWLFASWTTAATVLMPSLNIKAEVMSNIGYVTGSFAIGGACSGVTWWRIVGRNPGQNRANRV